MTDKEIVRTLRCTSTPGGEHEDCTGCPYYKQERLSAELKERLLVDTWPSGDIDKVGLDAADIPALRSSGRCRRWRATDELQ